MSTMDDTETPEPTDGDEDDSLPFAIRVMILLIVLAVLGVIVVDILHIAGAL